MDISKLKKRMSVIAADGRRIGFVKRMAWPDKIRLTCMSAGHGYDHLIPVAWIAHIDKYVYLNRASTYVAANWENTALSPARSASLKSSALMEGPASSTPVTRRHAAA